MASGRSHNYAGNDYTKKVRPAISAGLITHFRYWNSKWRSFYLNPASAVNSQPGSPEPPGFRRFRLQERELNG